LLIAPVVNDTFITKLTALTVQTFEKNSLTVDEIVIATAVNGILQYERRLR